MRYVIFSLLCAVLSLILLTAFAGDIGSPGDPSSGSNIYTLKDIYDYLSGGTEPSLPGSFQEPTAGPGSTMKSTKEIYDDIKAKFDQCNATPDQVMDTVKFFSTDAGNWGPKSGSLTTRSVSDTTVSQPAGYYDAFDLSAVDTDLAQGNIKSGANVFGVDGSVVEATGNAAAADVLSGKTFSSTGQAGVSGTMPNRGSVTYTPTTTDQAVAAGYHNGSGKVEGHADLVSGNIKSGVNIFGVAGDSNVVDTSTGDAATGDIKSGKKAWVDGSEVTGTIATQSLSDASTNVSAGYYNATTLDAVDSDLISGNIRSTITIFGVPGDSNMVDTSTGDAAAGEILNSKKAWVDGSEVTGSMTNVGQQNVTPTTTPVTITKGYHNGTGQVDGDANLVTGNIKAGVSIFGVNGKTEVVDTTDVTNPVAAERMKTGDVAFVNGNKVMGTGTKTLSDANDTVNAGYYEATTLSAVDADLVPGNIKNGVDIFGVTGRLVDASNATRVPKTGHTGCWSEGGGSIDCADTGQDGEYQLGVLPAVTPTTGVYGSYTVYGWTGIRFTDNLDGTVTDNLTGLIWLKNANCDGLKRWGEALSNCNGLENGDCDLSDGSSAGDWRLPNINELHSLVDPTQSNPALPDGHPFTGVQSSTTGRVLRMRPLPTAHGSCTCSMAP